MVLTESKRLELGTSAPDFSLPDTVSNQKKSLSDIRGEEGTVVMFICNHCPFVVHINECIVDLATQYQKMGVNFVAISSNDTISYPEDGPQKMKEHALAEGYPFPYLYDESQEIAQGYNAVCTPDIFFFGKELELVYHGQLDSSRPGSGIPVTGEDLKKAIDMYLENGEIFTGQKPSIGCSIKWK